MPYGITPVRVQTTSTGQVVVNGTMAGGADFGQGYQGQLSTYGYTHCTCTGGTINPCYSTCNTINAPARCTTLTPRLSADGIVGVWQP